MFWEGRERVENKERPGRENTSTDEQHVTEITDLVFKNRRLAIRDLADSTDTSRSSVKTVLKDILCK